ncbi:MAG: hypothetical protein AB7D57_05910 [Desulfovibrionaceae bacterium]
MSVTAKEIREDIARAKSFVQRGDLLRSLEALRSALDMMVHGQIFGREKFEVGALMDEALREVSAHKTLKKVLPAGLVLNRGQEARLYEKVDRLHRKLAEAIERQRVEKQRLSFNELDEMLISAQDFLKQGEAMEARKLFRRASEQFRDVPGLLSDIGTRLLLGGLAQEAVEYLAKALEIEPRDGRAHESLIACYELLNEPIKAEEAIKNALRRIGSNEVLLVKLGRLSVAQRNWSQAYDVARSILDKNPLSAPAKKILEQSKGKIFTARGAAQTARKPAPRPAADGTAPAAPAPAKAIKLDF